MSAGTKANASAGRPRRLGNVGTGQSTNGAEHTPLKSEIPPRRCKYYESCSANVCPLDPSYTLRTHLRDEPVCKLLLELSKPGGEATLRGVLEPDVAQAAITLAPALMALHAPIRKACQKSSTKGSRMQRAAQRREIKEACHE